MGTSTMATYGNRDTSTEPDVSRNPGVRVGRSQSFGESGEFQGLINNGVEFYKMVGRSEAILSVFRNITRVLDCNVPVCIEGETGTGKELVARAIHYSGHRRGRPFVVQNCAALPETLVESELFGYIRGAFTGARHDKKGLIEFSDGGTLFLDEISNASQALQVKLLRVLEEGEFTPLGGTVQKRVSIRIISATNHQLEDLVRQSKLREDLFYRLYVFPIRIPPLRDRKEDIRLIVPYFLEKLAGRTGTRVKGISSKAMRCLMKYHFPGNVRELENEIERAVILTGSEGEQIEVEHLSDRVVSNCPTRILPENSKARLEEQLKQVEAHIIKESLTERRGNVTETAQFLGLSRRGLTKKINRLGIEISGMRARTVAIGQTHSGVGVKVCDPGRLHEHP